MSRLPIPVSIADVSPFARALRDQLVRLERLPTHLELLNMLARASGHRNFQHMRSAVLAAPSAKAEAPSNGTAAPPAPDARKVEKILRYFDEQGRMARWPSKVSHQLVCLWGVWAHIPAGRRFSEADINGFITEAHGFGDYAVLRRYLVEMHMLTRTPDGRIYRRIEATPPPEAVPILEEVKRRAGL